MVLADREYPASPAIHQKVRVPDVSSGCDRDRVGVLILAVDALVIEVGEPYSLFADRIMAAPVLVHSRPSIEVGRGDISVDASTPPDDDLTTGFSRPQLGPIEVAAIPARHATSADGDCAVEQQIDGDRRRPCAVWRDLRLVHEMVRTINASPCPPPPHNAAAPVWSPRLFNSCATVSTRRAPLAPIGWPRATAPPLTLTRSSSS